MKLNINHSRKNHQRCKDDDVVGVDRTSNQDEDHQGHHCKRYWLQQATKHFQTGKGLFLKYYHSTSLSSTTSNCRDDDDIGCSHNGSCCDNLLKPAIESMIKSITIRESQLGRYHVATYEAYDLLRKILQLHAKLRETCHCEIEAGTGNFDGTEDQDVEKPRQQRDDDDDDEEEEYDEIMTQRMLVATCLLVVRIHIYLYPSATGQLVYPYLPGDAFSYVPPAAVVLADSSEAGGDCNSDESHRAAIIKIFQESIQLERSGDRRRVEGDWSGAIAHYQLAIQCEQEHLVGAYDSDGACYGNAIIDNPSVAYLYRKIACITMLLQRDDWHHGDNKVGPESYVLANIDWTKIDRIKPSLAGHSPEGQSKAFTSGSSCTFASFPREIVNIIDQDQVISMGDELSTKLKFGCATRQYQRALKSEAHRNNDMAGLFQAPAVHSSSEFSSDKMVDHRQSNCFHVNLLDLLLQPPETSGNMSTRPPSWNSVRRNVFDQDWNENWPIDENEFNIAHTRNAMDIDSIWTVDQTAAVEEYGIPQVEPTLGSSSSSPMTKMVNQMEELSGKLQQAMSRIVDLETKCTIRDKLDVETFLEPPSLLSSSLTTANCTTAGSGDNKRKRSGTAETSSNIPDDFILTISGSDLETIESSLLEVKTTTAAAICDEQRHNSKTVDDEIITANGNIEDAASGSFMLIEKWDDDHLTHIIRSDITPEYEESIERLNHDFSATATGILQHRRKQQRWQEEGDCYKFDGSDSDCGDDDGWVGC